MKGQTHSELQTEHTNMSRSQHVTVGRHTIRVFPSTVQACCVFVIEFTVHQITETVTVLANNCLAVFKSQFINDTSALSRGRSLDNSLSAGSLYMLTLIGVVEKKNPAG